MSEIINNVIDTAKERLKNPFLGAFILSWIAFNWKAISYFILSDEIIGERMETIEAEYVNWVSGLVFPILFAVFYLLGLPLLMLGIDLLSKWGLEKRKDHQNDLKISDFKRLTLVAKEEFLLEQEKAGYRDTKTLNAKIELLTNQLREKEELVGQLNRRISVLEDFGNEGIVHTNNLERIYQEFLNNQKYVRGLDLIIEELERGEDVKVSDELEHFFITNGLLKITNINGDIKYSLTPESRYIYQRIMDDKLLQRK
ncbi:hypothetical protein AAU57_08860 [Nonlabens sp. YIK11]|uniref:hypothetical protein n=1 Tax=Nonlabens sp. YIK11 TaxID=1453349 RepID=UPI0006DC8B41|nr:hypothetical protein [Nonlabens sp. YIK11]KQC33413.1 hypothetical protein AAU57_08860 [Nonlabens sp. YIK11]